jgi:hypothetical protein
MMVQGRDCVIILKTRYQEVGIPYSEETIREAVSLLTEEAAIEGDGVCRAIRESEGVTGCVVTPLTMGTALLLWALALGKTETPLFVSETRNLYKHVLHLVPQEDGPAFKLIRDRGTERICFENCRVTGFEFRIIREGTMELPGVLHLRLDIGGDVPPEPYLPETVTELHNAERFREDGVTCRINGAKYRNIYGLTISAKKTGGTKTEVRIHRILEEEELPLLIESVEITARLFRDCYEWREPGTFRLTLSRLVLTSDETAVDCADGVIGPIRYYVAGGVSAEVFTNSGETLG